MAPAPPEAAPAAAARAARQPPPRGAVSEMSALGGASFHGRGRCARNFGVHICIASERRQGGTERRNALLGGALRERASGPL